MVSRPLAAITIMAVVCGTALAIVRVSAHNSPVCFCPAAYVKVASVDCGASSGRCSILLTNTGVIETKTRGSATVYLSQIGTVTGSTLECDVVTLKVDATTPLSCILRTGVPPAGTRYNGLILIGTGTEVPFGGSFTS